MVALFPAIDFGGQLQLFDVEGGLLVVPEWIGIKGMTGCPTGNAMEGVELKFARQAGEGVGNQFKFFEKLPQRQQQQLSQRDPLTAVYLPKPLLDVKFGKVAPGINYNETDNGFIGYTVDIAASVKGVTVSLDAQKVGIALALSFTVAGFFVANIDLPTVGRQELAQARFDLPERGGQSSVTALVRPAIDAAGRVLLTCEITGIDLGTASVSIQLFSKYLGMAGGKAAVVGFILDAVVAKIIANNLPGIVFDEIKNNLDSHFFVLAELGGIRKYIPNLPNLPVFSSNETSAFIGSAYQPIG